MPQPLTPRQHHDGLFRLPRPRTQRVMPSPRTSSLADSRQKPEGGFPGHAGYSLGTRSLQSPRHAHQAQMFITSLSTTSFTQFERIAVIAWSNEVESSLPLEGIGLARSLSQNAISARSGHLPEIATFRMLRYRHAPIRNHLSNVQLSISVLFQLRRISRHNRVGSGDLTCRMTNLSD